MCGKDAVFRHFCLPRKSQEGEGGREGGRVYAREELGRIGLRDTPSIPLRADVSLLPSLYFFLPVSWTLRIASHFLKGS